MEAAWQAFVKVAAPRWEADPIEDEEGERAQVMTSEDVNDMVEEIMAERSDEPGTIAHAEVCQELGMVDHTNE